MDYFTLGALLWLLMFVLLGFIGGLWKAIAATLSLFLAYWASLLGAPWLTQQVMNRFASANLNETFTWGLSATLIFVLVGLLVRLLILTAARSLPVRNGLLNRGGGALVSGVYGSVLAVLVIWGAALVVDTWNIRQAQIDRPDAAVNTEVPVVNWSRNLMGQWVAWQMQRTGADQSVAALSAAIAEQPARRMAEVQQTLRSPEFQALVDNQAIQNMVRERGAEALQQTVEFEQLLQQPAVQQLRAGLTSQMGEWSDAEIARQLVNTWGNIQQIRDQPELAALAEDEEVKAFFQGGGQMTPSLLGKAQKALALVARAAPNGDTALLLNEAQP